MAQEASVFSNGVKLASEVLVSPGTSLLLEGNVSSVGSGLVHVAGGILSRVLLGGVCGPIAVAGLALNSYSKSTTGVGLLGQGAVLLGNIENKILPKKSEDASADAAALSTDATSAK